MCFRYPGWPELIRLLLWGQHWHMMGWGEMWSWQIKSITVTADCSVQLTGLQSHNVQRGDIMMPFVDWSLLARLVRISRGLVPDTRGESITIPSLTVDSALIRLNVWLWLGRALNIFTSGPIWRWWGVNRWYRLLSTWHNGGKNRDHNIFVTIHEPVRHPAVRC